HRGLVDDDDVVREVVAGAVTEPGGGAGAPAEEPVEGGRLRGADGGPVRRLERGELLADRLLEAGGGLARGRGERGAQAGTEAHLQAGEHPGDGRRLAGAGAAGEDGEAAEDRGGRGEALAGVVRLREEPTDGGPDGLGRRGVGDRRREARVDLA